MINILKKNILGNYYKFILYKKIKKLKINNIIYIIII